MIFSSFMYNPGVIIIIAPRGVVFVFVTYVMLVRSLLDYVVCNFYGMCLKNKTDVSSIHQCQEPALFLSDFLKSYLGLLPLCSGFPHSIGYKIEIDILPSFYFATALFAFWFKSIS